MRPHVPRLAKTGHEILKERMKAGAVRQAAAPQPVQSRFFCSDAFINSTRKEDVLARIMLPVPLNKVEGIVYVKSVEEVPLILDLFVNDESVASLTLNAGENPFEYPINAAKGSRLMAVVKSGVASDIWMCMYGIG